VFLGLLAIFYFLYQKYRDSKKFWDAIDKIPGPPAILFFGSTHKFKLDRVGFVRQLDDMAAQYGQGGIFRFWFGHVPLVILTKAHTAEVVLSSTKQIEKSVNYDFLKKWIGEGLLISGGEKWRHRRKLLTPTFHFSILSSFVDVYNRQSKILVKQLKPMVDDNLPFNMFPYIGRCALDIICETAMGIEINAQMNHKSDYVQAVVKICEIVFKYERMPWLRIKPIFNMFYGKEYYPRMKILREFIKKVIYDRINERKGTNIDSKTERKRRLAFLDLLLDIQDEHKLTYEDIREEVDTFMFEGHDTTSSGMGWAVFLLGHHKEVQDKVFQEMESIFGDDDRDATEDDIKSMKYLDCVIKETLRLFPPVPLFGRRVIEPFEIEGYQLPVGAMVTVGPVWIHRDPKHYGEDYMKFKPERFEKENATGRHPFAYVPFSAGSRNCIGQKFALMEEKVVLSSIVRNYEIKSMDQMNEVPGVPDLILRPPKGFNVRLTHRRKV
jgi:cytochrome P450 family 4 subfamily V